MTKLLIVLVLVGLASAIFFKEHPMSVNSASDAGYEQWFEQLLDHNSASQTTWQQRFTVYDQYFDPSHGTAILYICGEWTCNGLGGAGFALTLAQRYRGIVFALEHRFFGKSQPMGYSENSYSTSYFEKYLNVNQALDDLAYFITQIKQTGSYGVKPNMPWIHMGGSYPGALSAWFKVKYPNLTVGGLAASAVVEAINDFQKYDEQVRISTSKSGSFCPNIITAATVIADAYTDDPKVRDTFMDSFGAKGLLDGEFFYMFADIAAGFVQSSNRTGLCDTLEGLDPLQTLDAMRTLAKKVVDVDGYNTTALQNTTYDPDQASRQWMFMTCNELGYWQTSTLRSQTLRSPKVNVQFYQQWCKDIFGLNSTGQQYWADTSKINTQFGGYNLNAAHLIMTNGAEDPWQHASIHKQPAQSDLHVIYINCENCGHCTDTKYAKPTDPQELIDARNQIQQLFDQWISEHWVNQQQVAI